MSSPDQSGPEGEWVTTPTTDPIQSVMSPAKSIEFDSKAAENKSMSVTSVLDFGSSMFFPTRYQNDTSNEKDNGKLGDKKHQKVSNADSAQKEDHIPIKKSGRASSKKSSPKIKQKELKPVNSIKSKIAHLADLKLSNSYKNLSSSKNIEEFLKLEKQDFEKEKKEPKILILGSSDSGKSTLLKQLKIMYGEFTRTEILEYKKSIYTGIAFVILTIVNEWCKNYSNSTTDMNAQSSIDLVDVYSNLISAAEKIASDKIYPFDELLSKKEDTKNLWNEKVVKCILNENQCDFPDTVEYFMNELDRIFSNDYIPSEQDILMVRVKTKQISETILSVKNTRYHFYDVSGIKKDRVHWLQFFDNCNTVLFVASIAAYDQVLLEDSTVNRMADSLVLLCQMSNHKLLEKVPFIVFLNKKDIFKKKINSKPITRLFPDYTDKPNDPNTSAKFIVQKFKQQCPVTSQVVCHLTCATDTKSMQVIIKQVLFAELQKSLDHLL